MTQTKPRTQRLLSIMLTFFIVGMMFNISPKLFSEAANPYYYTNNFNKPELTGNMGEDVARVAEANIGKKYDFFGYTAGSHWCCYFATDCTYVAGVPRSLVPKAAGCTTFYNTMLKNNNFTKIVEKKYKASTVVSGTPQRGDIVLFEWDGVGYTDNSDYDTYKLNHIGIVVNYNASKKSVDVIGGNQDGSGSGKAYAKSSSVTKVNYSITSNYIARIIRPNYTTGTVIKYDSIKSGVYRLKNASTGTYLTVDGAKAANGQNISVAAKSDSKAQQFKASGGTSSYLYSMIDNAYDVNPYSDTPKAGTNVTLYKKDTSGQQEWGFEPVTGGYVVRLNKYNETLALAVDGTNVKVTTANTSDKKQIWTLEPIDDATLSSIAVTAPTKNTYYVGEELNTTGMKVTATYSNKSTKDVTSSAKVSCDLSKAGEATATVSYAEGTISKTATFKVTVKAMPESPFKGEGTAESPYLISSKADLEALRELVNVSGTNTKYGWAYYKQTCDIDFENEEWMPIGAGYDGDNHIGTYDYSIMFYGSYDGDCHYITNFKQTANLKATGLFGFIRGESATVKNLVIKGSITNSWKDGYYTGGIVGQPQYFSTIENCAFIGDITGTGNAGGIAGRTWQSATIKNCYHLGNVTSNVNAGGIVGLIEYGEWGDDGDDTLVENCYHANGTVKAETNTGAVVGNCIYYDGIKNTVHINNCYASSDCGANVQKNNATADTSILLRPSEMKTASGDLGSAFVDVTDINGGYPALKWETDKAEQTTGSETDAIVGDANLDGKVSVADAVAIMQFIGNKDKYDFSDDARKNADCYNTGDGITGMDALTIQKVDAGIYKISDLPVKE